MQIAQIQFHGLICSNVKKYIEFMLRVTLHATQSPQSYPSIFRVYIINNVLTVHKTFVSMLWTKLIKMHSIGPWAKPAAIAERNIFSILLTLALWMNFSVCSLATVHWDHKIYFQPPVGGRYKFCLRKILPCCVATVNFDEWPWTKWAKFWRNSSGESLHCSGSCAGLHLCSNYFACHC
jgi:hypothetical protein